MENKSYLDEGRLEKLEQSVKQMEQIANEAEVKYEEVGAVEFSFLQLIWYNNTLGGFNIYTVTFCVVNNCGVI